MNNKVRPDFILETRRETIFSSLQLLWARYEKILLLDFNLSLFTIYFLRFQGVYNGNNGARNGLY